VPPAGRSFWVSGNTNHFTGLRNFQIFFREHFRHWHRACFDLISSRTHEPNPPSPEDAMTPASRSTVYVSDSTDRTAALTTTRPGTSAAFSKSAATRVGGAARRLLNALMRSLATPHI
jgi:hypothetical protein